MAIPLLIWQGCLTSTCWSIIGGFWLYFVDRRFWCWVVEILPCCWTQATILSTILKSLPTRSRKRQRTIAPFNTDAFYQLINKSISSLLLKMSIDYKPCWREFLIWIGAVGFGERYFVVHERFEEQDRRELRVILPLIIRDSYVRNFNDKLVEMLVTTIANNPKFVKPMTATSAWADTYGCVVAEGGCVEVSVVFG